MLFLEKHFTYNLYKRSTLRFAFNKSESLAPLRPNRETDFYAEAKGCIHHKLQKSRTADRSSPSVLCPTLHLTALFCPLLYRLKIPSASV